MILQGNMETQGKKEITEAVITATLVTIVGGIVGLGFRYLDSILFKKKEEPVKSKADEK